jgi:N-acetylmuramoyl-L-alanine amidase
MSKNLKDVLPFAKAYIGSPYVFGVLVPKLKPGYVGAFDCAEFVAYAIAQVLKVTDYGVRNGDAYTGFFQVDGKAKGILISVKEAASIPGAILLRYPAPGAIGHVAFSQGNGKTIEAHSTKYGVIESKVDGRRWDTGIILPGIEYKPLEPVKTDAPVVVYRFKHPMMQSPLIKAAQNRLKKLGFYMEPKTDEFFGTKMLDALLRFQRSKGLIVDGEFTPTGETALELGI